MNNFEKFPSLPGSQGEHEMQEKFQTQDKATDFYNRQMLDYLAPMMQNFIAAQEMVFISTSDKNGECDCSLRSGESGFITVIDEKRIIYPDYKGNGVLASAGNISENPHIGMLFVDFFEDKVGLHVNGKAHILEETQLEHFGLKQLPSKQKTVFWVLVEVEEAYIHCSKNIPLFTKNDDLSQINKGRPINYFELADS
ncbi:MAG: pyridoxamine 5'-phosphate oxidase family protein [Sulfuricurvum sp.]|nr:pyridoxamine 5'-phosphate oxidase family protein [Sulfuricurvum sp.]